MSLDNPCLPMIGYDLMTRSPSSYLDPVDIAHLLIAKYDRALRDLHHRTDATRYARLKARRDEVTRSLLEHINKNQVL